MSKHGDFLRAKMRAMPRGSVKGIKRMLFDGHAWRPCYYCAARLTPTTATVDHVVPLSKGGYNRRRNAVLACSTCNHAKGSKSKEQFIAARARVAD